MLYIIASPIGNLSDISERMVSVLNEVDFVISEDTRYTAKILNHLKIKKRTVSLHEHSADKKIDDLLSEIAAGKQAAYLTDAGTPNLSDPGGKIVARAIEKGIIVSPIAGPSALTALISVAPFSCTNFVFMGYFPKKKGRETMIGTIKNIEMPIFFFESPHRIKKTLAFLQERLTGHKILIGRELTKKFEEIIYSELDIINTDEIRDQGEFVFALVK